MLLYLIHNPKIQEMLQKELDQVIGPNRLPKLKDKELTVSGRSH